MINEVKLGIAIISLILIIMVVHAAPQISFISPSSNLLTDNLTIGINLSISEPGLKNLIFNWNGTNYTLYEDDLIMMFNFENITSLSENESTIIDASRIGNNGTFALNSSWSRIVMIDSFNLSSTFVQGIAYDGEFIYISYGGDATFGNVLEKRYLNGSWIANATNFINNSDYETSGITYMDGNLYVSTNGYPGSLSGNTYNKVMIFNTTLSPIQNLTGFTGDYLEGVNKYAGFYWAIFDDYSPLNATIHQYNLTWSYNTNFTLRTNLGANNHKYQGVSFYNDSLGNSYLFANIHEGTSPETLDKYLWNGTGFTLFYQLYEATEFGHQDIEIWNNTFFWVSREQNKSFITSHTYSNYFTGKYGYGAVLGYNSSITAALTKFNKNAGTISFWVRVYEFKTTEWLFSEQGTANNNNEIELYISQSGNITPIVWGGATSNIPTQISLNKNEWTQIGLTWNSTAVCAYKNGNLNGACDTTVTLPSAVATTCLFGKAANSATSWTAGMMDEIRIYNRSLSSSEVYEVYASNLQRFNSTQWYLYINQSKNATTLLDLGSYTYSAFATNLSSDLSQTTSNNVTIQADINYPIFSSYWDNSGNLTASGIALFNVTILNTNGTVLLEINGANISVTNLTSNLYNTSISLTAGTYNYTYHSYGNGIQQLSNDSVTRSYIVNTASSGGSTNPGGGSGGGLVGYCIKDSNCKKGYICYDKNCTQELFKIKISSIKTGNEWVSFTYDVKTIKSFNGNVTIKYWVQKGDLIIANNSQIFSISNLSEKSLIIPTNLTKGDYDLYIQVSYNNFTVQEIKSFKYSPKKETAKIEKLSWIFYLIGVIILFIFFYLIVKFSRYKK